MRIDFSEPECTNCFHCRSLGVVNSEESEPSYVIVSSVTSMPVSSGPVQALEHDTTAVGSTSTSSPVQAISHDSAAVGSTSTSSPVQALGHDSAAVGSTSKSSPDQALSHDSAAVGSISSSPVQALGHDSVAVGSTSKSSPDQALSHDSAAVGSTSTSPPVQAIGHDSAAVGSTSKSSPDQALSHDSAAVGLTSTSSPVEALVHDDSAANGSISTLGLRTLDVTSICSDASGGPTVQATSGSCASAISTSSTSSLFQGFSPLGFAPAVTSVNSAPETQDFGQATPTFAFRLSPNGFESPFAVTSVSSAPTQAFGPNSFGFGASATSTSSTSSPVHSSSLFGSAPAITSVSSATTQAIGPNTCGFNPFTIQPSLGSMQAPVQATSIFGTSSSTTPSIFRSMQAPVQATFGSGSSGTSSSSVFLPFGYVRGPLMNGSSLFMPMQNSPWTTNSLTTGGSVDQVRSDVGVLPAPPSSNLFGPNPSTPTEVFGATPGGVSWPAQDYPRTGVNRFAPPSSGFNLFGQNVSPTGSFPGFPRFGVDNLPGSNSNPYVPNPCTTGSRHPRYVPTPSGENGGNYISISASHPYKSHEELRWEDYKRGNKGSKTNAVFDSPKMTPLFASPSVPDHPQRTTFDTPQETSTGPAFSFSPHNPALTGVGTQPPNSSPISSSVQRPHETAAVSSPASGCTACGATTSTSASGYSYFNGATLAPPSAATTYLPRPFFPTSGYGPIYGYGPVFGCGPTYGYGPIYGYGHVYGYGPAYGYGPTYGYEPAYGYGPTYGYGPRAYPFDA